MKEKLYHLLNDKLFDIAERYKKSWMRSNPAHLGPPSFDRNIWKAYLEEMGIFSLVCRGWFKNEDLNGDSMEELSFADLQGQKVDPGWVAENLLVVPDPLMEHRVGVPKELAVRALALGYFPDSPTLKAIFPNEFLKLSLSEGMK